MMPEFERIAVLGATGPTGRALAEILAARSTAEVRVISRSEAHLERCFPGGTFERAAADAFDASQTLAALEGCDLVYDCIGLPADLMDRHPVTARNIAAAIGKTRARCVQVSSYWSYLPIETLPLTEAHPRRGGPPWARLRRETEDVLQQAGGAILHLPDFYGPWVHTSTVQNALTDAVDGRPMNWVGDADVEHEFVYVPDAMKMAAAVATHDGAYGQRWVLPGSGPMTGNELVAILGRLGCEATLRPAGPVMLRIVSFFNRDLRRFMQMVPHYAKTIRYDASKLVRLLGSPPEMTSYEDGIRETLRWLDRREST